jgi:molybdopterin-synthase adenylyltransferase
MLTTEELQRYQRQIMVRGFGEAGQESLKQARVFIAGAGGLGSPAALYLAAAGIGTLRIVDSDSVDLGNLNRQILHWTRDIGKKKVSSARRKLHELNPEVKIEAVQETITQDNINELVAGCDLILDAVDNLATRYILNQAAVDRKIPLFHGAVSGYEGRAMTVLPGQTACLMCLYQGVSLSQKTPVIGATPGVIACLQVTEVIKYLTGAGQLLTDRFLIYDGLNMRFAEIKVTRDPHCKQCGTN